MATLLITSGSPTMRSTVMRGSSEEKGSWKMICMFGRTASQLFTVQLFQVDPALLGIVEADLPSGGIQQAHDRAPGGGLTAAAFAHQAQGLAFIHEQVNPIDGLYRAHTALDEAALDREMLLQVFHIQKQFIFG